MKTEEEVKRQLEAVYEHRLRLRIERRTKRMCRNCTFGVSRDFDLGDFGTMTKWECREGRHCCDGCGFVCRNDGKAIEDEMLAEISDPSICGAKEPKIAMLLWVLHGNKCSDSEHQNEKKEQGGSFWSRITSVFR